MTVILPLVALATSVVTLLTALLAARRKADKGTTEDMERDLRKELRTIRRELKECETGREGLQDEVYRLSARLIRLEDSATKEKQ